ncbi:MAG TPA: magnesium-translocating P-type ATPase, partial [Erwinia persicina]|nr:magnesium-translocating P-type ATPase [Erwinia persicina]
MKMHQTHLKMARELAIASAATQSQDHTLAHLNTQRQGLTREEAAARLAQYGPNQVASDRAPAALIQLFQAFNNPFIWILMVLAVISVFTDYVMPLRRGEETDLTGATIMLVMISLSGLLRFWQEYRTNKATEALKSLVSTTATVLRRSHTDSEAVSREVPLQEVVPGDIVQLSAGDMIPADVRLLSSRDLFVSQAALSGEALPVEKYDSHSPLHRNPAAVDDQDLLSQPGICLMGTSVASGSATAVVVATGGQTCFGSLAKSLVGDRPQTSFDRGVNSVSWLLIRFMLVMVPVVLLINGYTKGDWSDALLFALAVAVGLTPEMLPMIVSSNLAKGAIALSKRKVVVKRLNAIQNLGAMDVLCSDKTGTLTQDKILLAGHLNLQGHSDDRVLQLAWLNSRHQTGVRNLMDRAVLGYCQGNAAVSGLWRYRKLDELPFDFERRRLSVLVADEGQQTLICKGAVEEMLAVSAYRMEAGEVRPLDEAGRAELRQLAGRYNQQGFRVLMVAMRQVSEHTLTSQLSAADERELVITGLLTFLDPPKESAAAAIAALHEQGVTVKILTGDNAIVTAKICR